MPESQIWWWPALDGETVPDHPPIDITDRVAAVHVPGRCDRICLDSPAGPCVDECMLEWAARTQAEADDA